MALDRETRKPTITRTDAIIDSLFQHDGKNAVNKPWSVDTALSRAARLQSNAKPNDIERQKRRNDVLFLGKLLM